MTADIDALADTVREGFTRVELAPDGVPIIVVGRAPEPSEAALSSLVAIAKEAEQILPADEVCACLDETGGRQVRVYERCERCHALMESDLAEQLAEQSESADEWREQWERAEQRAEVAERALKDAQMKERALTDYFADASRRADEWQQGAERAERERDGYRARSKSLAISLAVDLDKQKAAEERVAELELVLNNLRRLAQKEIENNRALAIPGYRKGLLARAARAATAPTEGTS